MDGSDLQSKAEALKGASETLLIPLACRARGSRDRVLESFKDPAAEQLVETLGVDLDRYAVSREMLLGVIYRGEFFDRCCLDFLSRHPGGTVLNLGAGLNTSYERIRHAFPDGGWRWIDTDLAPVIELREGLFEDDERRTTAALDASNIEAIQNRLDSIAGPLLVVSEAVLIYVRPKAVAEVFNAVAQRGNAEFVFDWVSPMMMRNSRNHPAMKKLRDESVVFTSSLKRASDIGDYDPRWRVKAESSAPMTKSSLGGAIAAFFFSLFTFGRRAYGCAHAHLV